MKIKQLLFTFLGLIMTLTVFGQDSTTTKPTDTTTVVTTVPAVSTPATPVCTTSTVSKLSVDGSVFSRKVENGIGFNSSAAVTGTLTYNFCDWASLSSTGVGINSENNAVGSSVENSFSVKNKNKHFTLTVSDLFYFAGETRGTESTNYFNYGTSTGHFINAGLKYGNNEVFGVVRGTVYKADADENNGVFIGAGYQVFDNLQLDAGYITDASTSNFRTDKGLTHIGLTATKNLNVSEGFNPTLKVNLSVNPTDNVSEVNGISSKPIQFGVGLIF